MIKRKDFTHLLDIEKLENNIEILDEIKNNNNADKDNNIDTKEDKQNIINSNTTLANIIEESNVSNIKSQGELKYQEILEKYGYTEEELK